MKGLFLYSCNDTCIAVWLILSLSKNSLSMLRLIADKEHEDHKGANSCMKVNRLFVLNLVSIILW